MGPHLVFKVYSGYTSTPKLPFKAPKIPANRGQKALNGGTLGRLGTGIPDQGARPRAHSFGQGDVRLIDFELGGAGPQRLQLL